MEIQMKSQIGSRSPLRKQVGKTKGIIFLVAEAGAICGRPEWILMSQNATSSLPSSIPLVCTPIDLVRCFSIMSPIVSHPLPQIMSYHYKKMRSEVILSAPTLSARDHQKVFRALDIIHKSFSFFRFLVSPPPVIRGETRPQRLRRV